MTDHEVDQSGAHVTVAPGDRVVIRVEENAATGYQWSATSVSGPLEQEAHELIPPEDAAPGAAGRRRVVFRALERGQGAVELSLQRPWEGGGPPAAHFRVEVSVS